MVNHATDVSDCRSTLKKRFKYYPSVEISYYIEFHLRQSKRVLRDKLSNGNESQHFFQVLIDHHTNYKWHKMKNFIKTSKIFYIHNFQSKFHLNEKLPVMYLVTPHHLRWTSRQSDNTWPRSGLTKSSGQTDNSILCVMPCQLFWVNIFCNTFLNQLSFAMLFYQILESNLTVFQKGLVSQFVIYC